MSKPEPAEADYPLNCPSCGVSLLDKPIPDAIAHNYSGRYYKREVAIEYPEKYDGVHHFQCPDCNATWGGYRAFKGGD